MICQKRSISCLLIAANGQVIVALLALTAGVTTETGTDAGENGGRKGLLLAEQFLQSKKQSLRSRLGGRGYFQDQEEINMEYLIAIGVVAMMALYAFIIVGCLKQPEWQ
jgi:hypothetical protein